MGILKRLFGVREVKSPLTASEPPAVQQSSEQGVQRAALAALGERPLEDLARIARTDQSYEARLMAMQHLSSFTQPEAFEVIVERLADDNLSVRRDAIRHLIAKGNEGIVTSLAIEVGQGPTERPTRLDAALEAAMQSDDYRARWFAVWFDWKMGRVSTPLLLRALADRDSDVRSLARRILGESAEPECPLELFCLHSEAPTEDVRSEVIRVLINRRDVRAIDPLINVLRGGDVGRIAWAERELKTFGPAAVDGLASVLRNGSPEIQVQAANILAEIGDHSAIPALQGGMKANDASVRSAVLTALARLKAPDLLATLLTGLRDPDASVRRQAVTLLNEEPRAVEPLIACLQDSDNQVRAKAARALGRLGDSSAALALAQTFVRAAREDDKNVLREASDALKRLGDAATDHLLPALTDATPNVRICAAWALGEAGNQRARDALRTLTADTDPEVREAALGALEQIGGNPG